MSSKKIDEVGMCAIYMFFLQNGGGSLLSYLRRRGGGRGFDRLIGNSKGVRPNPQKEGYAPATLSCQEKSSHFNPPRNLSSSFFLLRFNKLTAKTRIYTPI